MQQLPADVLDAKYVGEGFPVVFGHSYLWDSEMWAPQVATLKDRFRCILPDIWGHGNSLARPGHKLTVEQLAEDHIQLLDAAGIEQYALVGLSAGGMWGIHLALNYPERIKALVLMNTYVGPEPPENLARYTQMLDTVEHLGTFPQALVDQVVPLFFSPVTLAEQPDIVDRFRDHLLSIPAEKIPTVVGVGRGIFTRNSLLDRLKDIKVPTLIIAGEDDRARPVHEAREMAELIPGAEFEILKRAGHISSIEVPSDVNAMLSDFLGRQVG